MLPLMPSLVAKMIEAYNEPADGEDAPEVPLPHARLHDLRHAHATLLLGRGCTGARPRGPAEARRPSITVRGHAHVIRRHAGGIADVFAAADHVDEDQDDKEDGPDPSAVMPC